MNIENIGETYEDGFGRIDWYINLDTNSTFCVPEISPEWKQFQDEIAAATLTLEEQNK